MGDHAHWRLYPGDPRSILGWTLLSIAQDFSRVMLSTVGVVVLITLTVFLFLISGEIDVFSFGTGWSLPIRRRRAPASLAHLAPIPSRDPWYPVRVQISQDGFATGFDDAIAIFGDGWMHVEGRRTMFSLLPEQLSLARCGDGCLLVLAGQTLELRPYDQIDDDRGLADAFDLSFRRLIRRPAQPTGLMRRPPLDVHAWAFGKAWSGLIWGLLLSGLAGGMAARGDWVFWFVAVIIAACGLWRTGRGVWELWGLRLIDLRCS